MESDVLIKSTKITNKLIFYRTHLPCTEIIFTYLYFQTKNLGKDCSLIITKVMGIRVTQVLLKIQIPGSTPNSQHLNFQDVAQASVFLKAPQVILMVARSGNHCATEPNTETGTVGRTS